MRTIATFASKSPEEFEWGCRLQACVSHLDVVVVVEEIGGGMCITYGAAAAATTATGSGTGRILGMRPSEF